MPKWVAEKPSNRINLIILIFFMLSIFFLISQTLFIIATFRFTTALLFGISLSFFVYMLTKLIFDLNRHNDFIEITTEGIKFRSTPSLGNGWLPKTAEMPLNLIDYVDIVSVRSFLNPDVEQMGLLLKPKMSRAILIGQNLSKEHIFEVGLALKGSVRLSKALSSLLGESEVSDQLKNIVNFGKAVWKSFQNRGD